MLKFKLIVFLLLCSVSSTFSQKGGLLLWNSDAKQQHMIVEGALIKVSFNGYLGQKTLVKGHLVSLTDSSLILQKGSVVKKESTEILMKDILGMRTYSAGRQISELVFNLAVVAGAIVLTSVLPTLVAIPNWVATVSGVVVGVVGRWLVPRLFSEKMQYNFQSEWKMAYVPLDM